MKKSFLFLAVIALLGFTSCVESKTEEVKEDVVIEAPEVEVPVEEVTIDTVPALEVEATVIQ